MVHSLANCRYGIGHWDEMARDERLGLGDKLALAAIEKGRGKEKEAAIDPEFRHLPKGQALEPPLHSHCGLSPIPSCGEGRELPSLLKAIRCSAVRNYSTEYSHGDAREEFALPRIMCADQLKAQDCVGNDLRSPPCTRRGQMSPLDGITYGLYRFQNSLTSTDERR